MNVDEIIERTQWDFFWMPDGVEIVDRPEIQYVRSTLEGARLDRSERGSR